MALRIYNTMTQAKETFEPLVPGRVGMYVCGVTVYDMCHIGHARAYVAFDVVYRYLAHLGFDVTYVRNYTDIDDKIIKRAAELGERPGDVSERYIAEFETDMAALDVRPANIAPRVTEHLPEIIETIRKIVENGHGYAADGDVYFSIDSYAAYGKLSKRKLDDMVAGASERVEVDTRKRNPLDFALWKASKPGEPAWDSPWGPGRPGWHIECSAMSAKHLGATFDIHGGGKDLVFPHHENEIAQSEAASGQPFARLWMHNGFVNVDKEKMSKSLCNFFTIREVLGRYHPQALRYFLLTTHYRSPINYSQENLDEATGRVEYVCETLQKVAPFLAQPAEDEADVAHADVIAGIEPAFREAMDDDFNTARAIGSLSDAIRLANEVADAKDKPTKKRRPATLRRLMGVLRPLFGVLGLFDGDPTEILLGIRDRKLTCLPITKLSIEARIAERLEARAAKDFARSDAIRAELAAAGIQLMDTPTGTTWKVA